MRPQITAVQSGTPCAPHQGKNARDVASEMSVRAVPTNYGELNNYHAKRVTTEASADLGASHACDFASILIWLEFGLAAASQWEDLSMGSTKYLAVEAVGDEIPPSHHIPVELSEEQFLLLDWASNVTRPRRGYLFPPGILLGAALAAATLFILFKLKYGTPLGKQGEQIELTVVAPRAPKEDTPVVEDTAVDEATPTDQDTPSDQGTP
ncbi:hypothetical protein Esti_003659 [Eimeria stiedai]